jgi:hypothetical protein
MSIFNKKQRVLLKEFCWDFYDKYILNISVANIDVGIGVAEVFKKSIVEVAPSFINVDLQNFSYEIILMRIEIFGLALLHKLGDKNTAVLSQYTKDYLIKNNRSDIWDDLELYNQAIAASSKLNQNTESKKGRAYLVFLDRVRMELFDLWYKKGFDSKCVARAANRIMTDVAWKKKLTHTYLMIALCKRLGYEYNEQNKLCNKIGNELNEEAQFRIIAMIKGFYDGCIDSLNDVVIND